MKKSSLKIALFTFVLMGSQAMGAEYSVTVFSQSIPGIDRIDIGSAAYTVDVGGSGESITDVNVELVFGKSDAECNTIGSDDNSGYATEIAYRLVSPLGTSIALIENDSGDAGSGVVNPSYSNDDVTTPLNTTVVLDDAASDLVGSNPSGAPVDGAFMPIQSLSGLNGEDPSGTWTLTGYDSSESDPLCHQSFQLTVTTANNVYVETNTPKPQSGFEVVDESNRPYLANIPASASEVVTAVTAELKFSKSDTSGCTDIGTDDLSGYNSEIAYRLESPGFVSVALIENNSNNAGATNPGPSYSNDDTVVQDVIVVLDESATLLVGSTNGGTPISGSFLPMDSLTAFNGELASGDWTITAYDDSAGDPLCHHELTLNVSTELPDLIFADGFEPQQ